MSASEFLNHEKTELDSKSLLVIDTQDEVEHKKNFSLNLTNLDQNDGPLSISNQKDSKSPKQACETQRYNTNLLLDPNDQKVKPLLHQNFFNSPQKAHKSLQDLSGKEKRDLADESYKKLCSPSSVNQFQKNVQKKAHASLLQQNSTYKVVQSIFNQDVKILIRARDCYDFETVLNLKASIYSSESQSKVISIELRDGDDPNFFHLLECSEKEYDQIKNNELMLNEFQYFSDQFRNLLSQSFLNSAKIAHSKNEPFYKCEFVLFSEEKSYLRFKQVSNDKESDYMKLKLVNVNNQSIQRYLSVKLAVAMSGQPSSKLNLLKEELFAEKAEMQEKFDSEKAALQENFDKEILNVVEKFENEKDSYFKTFDQTVLKLEDKVLSLKDELQNALEGKKEAELLYQEQCEHISQFKKEIQSLHFISIEFLEKAKNEPKKQNQIEHLDKLNKQIEQSINNVDLISEKSALRSQYKTPASSKKMQKEHLDDKKSQRSHLQTQNQSKKLLRNEDQQSALLSQNEQNYATEKKEMYSTHVGMDQDLMKKNGKKEVIFEEKSQSDQNQKIFLTSKIIKGAPEYDDLVSIGNNSEDIRQIEKNRNAPKWIGQNIDPQWIKNEIIQRLQGEYDELISMGNNSEDLKQIQMNINNVQKWYKQESKNYSLTDQKLAAEYDELISMGNNSEDLRQIELNLKNVQKWAQLDQEQKRKIQAEYDDLVSIDNNSEDLRQIEKNKNVGKWANIENQKFIQDKSAYAIKQGEIIQASNFQQSSKKAEIDIQNVDEPNNKIINAQTEQDNSKNQEISKNAEQIANSQKKESVHNNIE